MSNPNYKRFTLNSKYDYLTYLRFIIIQSHKFMKRHSFYKECLEREIEELNLMDQPQQAIDSNIYEEHNDRIQFVSSKLLNLFGDLQGDSLSYYKFRKTLVRRNTEVKDTLGTLSKEILEILSSINQTRNWALHMPESLLNSHSEIIKKSWSEAEHNLYLSTFTPINVPFFEKYEGTWLLSLYHECCLCEEDNVAIFNQMICDYKALLGRELTIEEIVYDKRPFEEEIALSKTSFEMQQRKYTGQN
ncbi:hypothetical protein [Bacillus wiedmannii]|uniref:hypothetical protein n=1 Tax=Bacillus wiedmannii TaxID=1890302 RepID=UPI000BFD2577|nr:hypothetical protein [Bacillus wiedmannii]PHG66179.1 hypothetical protein COI55_19275 [Bacillus wiedmannii]